MDRPKYIKATRTIIYDVDKIIRDLEEVAIDDSPITMDDVMMAIETWATDDLSCGFGHVIDHDEIEFEEMSDLSDNNVR